MPWMSFADRANRVYRVDLDAAARIFYAEAFASEQLRRASLEVTRGGIYPDTYTVAIDFRGLRAAVRLRAQNRFTEFQSLMWRDGGEALRMLVQTYITTVQDTEALKAKQRDASRNTTRNIDRAVRAGEWGVRGATFLRDGAGAVLVVGSTVLTGGAAVAVLGAGSALQGTGTYQDTGSVGAAVITTSLTFSFGLIPLARAATVPRGMTLPPAEEAALFVITTAGDVAKGGLTAMVQGEDARPAVASALLNSGMGAVTGRLGGDFIESLSFPAQIITRVSEESLRGAAANAAADRLVQTPRVMPMATGCISAACAAMAPRTQSHFDAEFRIYREVMVPYLPEVNSSEATSGDHSLSLIRESLERETGTSTFGRP